MSWYVIIPLQILAAYISNKLIEKYLEKPYKTWFEKYPKTWEKSSDSYVNWSDDERKKYDDFHKISEDKQMLITQLHWFFPLTIIIFPIIKFVEQDVGTLKLYLLIGWLTSALLTCTALSAVSKKFDKKYNFFMKSAWYFSILTLGWLWLFSVGISFELIDKIFDNDLGFTFLLISLFISFFAFPFWFYEKATKYYYSSEKSKIPFWSELDLVYRKTTAWIIIGIIYLPIIVRMLDSKY